MNPLSISLRNFLCYSSKPSGEPYVFDFRDHRLWSICGDNGAGKSAIFDAVTYCLYGQHRGGNSRDDELVRRGQTEMLACFEFEHGGREYRVTRTIQLGVRPRKGTPVVRKECRMEWQRQDGEWVEVPETSSVRGLEDAVRRILGYGSETLTASVLLLQGKSDRLIEAGGKDRFDILSGILDLSRYERLAERARDRAKQARANQQLLERALAEAPPPEQADVEEAARIATEAELAADQAEAAASLAASALTAAREYSNRLERMTGLLKDEDSMAEALADAPTITAEAEEAKLLAAILPRLTQALRAESDAAAARAEATKCREAAANVDVSAGEKAAADAEKAHAAAKQKHQALLKRLSDVRMGLEGLKPEVNAAEELERLEGQIRATSEDVRGLVATHEGIADLRAKVARLRLLDSCKSLIASYRKAREALAAVGVAAEGGDPAADLESKRARAEELQLAAGEAASAESSAQREQLRAEAKVSEATAIVRQREAAGQEGTCSHCGQKVPPAHIKKEIAAARSALRAAEGALARTQRHLTDATASREAAEASLRAAKDAEAVAAERAAAARRAHEEIEELELEEDFARLPEDVSSVLRAPVTELKAGIEALRTAQAELPGLEQELAAMAAAEASAEAKSALIRSWEEAVSAILASFSRVRLTRAMTQAADLQRTATELEVQETSQRSAEGEAAESATRARDALNQLRSGKRDLEQKAALFEQRADGFEREARAALTGVDDKFLPVTQKVVELARDRLGELDDAASRLELLRKAQRELDGLRGQIRELRGQIEVTPDAHRAPVQDAEATLTAAGRQLAEAKAEAGRLRRCAYEMGRSREERLQRQADAQRHARERAVWERAGQLLGRGGIQTALMRSALEDIQESANAMLSRISGGQLQLEVTCEEGRGGIEEIYFRCLDAASAELPLDVQFLSGGQRFRCAVALAAGIGQRAGSGGSMPSQIIDEGFGSLDAQGRAEMLEEVRLMSEFYERVIVVSHMESFHDQSLFPARFELRKEGTETVVTLVG